jgi:hypothetical protein
MDERVKKKLFIAVIVYFVIMFVLICVVMVVAMVVAKAKAAEEGKTQSPSGGHVDTSSPPPPPPPGIDTKAVGETNTTSEIVNPSFKCTNAMPGDSSYFRILRRKNGAVECLTTDGFNCKGFYKMADCQADTMLGVPLTCDSEVYRSRWGPVSSTSGTWCTRDDI